MRLRQLLTITTAVALTHAAPAFASVDSANISIGMADQVKISGIDDVAFGSWSSGALRKVERLCIFRNGNGRYRIRMDGGEDNGTVDAATGDGFFLSNAAGERLRYRVRFSDRNSGSWKVRNVRRNTSYSSGRGFKTDPACNGNDNARIQVRITRRDLERANPGDYVGTLYLTVIPD